ncbi:MAG TPA: ribosome silencing factor [Pseudomonadales bacterium]
MTETDLKQIVIKALEDLKANNIVELDVSGLTDMTDLMIVASGTSSRHVKALADNVVSEVKKQGVQPTGVEGEQTGDWVLVDLADILVHVMLPETREFYNLEKLWSLSQPRDMQDQRPG